MTTCSGTTTIPRAAATSDGRLAVESVTTTTGMDARLTPPPAAADESPGSDDDVDQARLAHDHPAHVASLDRTHHALVGQGQLLELGGGDVRADLQPRLHLALHLDDG